MTYEVCVYIVHTIYEYMCGELQTKSGLKSSVLWSNYFKIEILIMITRLKCNMNPILVITTKYYSHMHLFIYLPSPKTDAQITDIWKY